MNGGVRAIEHSFPAGHLLRLVELVRRWEVTASELLAPVGLDEAQLLEPTARISASTLAATLRRARTLTGEPGLGFYLGLQKTIASYGQLGLATQSAATLREAIELAVELSHAVSSGVTMVLREEGDVAAVTVTEHVDMGDVQEIAALNFYVGMVHNTRALTGHPFEGWVELPFPEPEYYERFRHLLPHARFSQPVGQFIFQSSYLDLRLPHPDPATVSLAKRQCEKAMESLGFERSLAGRVRQMVVSPEGLRSQEQVASALGMSSRTLKRRLAEHGTSYTGLRDQECRERALHLLRVTELSIEEIGLQLGYSTLPNFARAFRRWTGHSPAQYRQDNRIEGGLLPRGPA